MLRIRNSYRVIWVKITAENIPAATQLFTPRWIVRYMVENTLGKLWLSLKPESKLRNHMPYYIESPEGNAPSPIPDDLNPLLGGRGAITDITFLDPCQGSGHVLVYAFDLFTKIYEEEGYNTNEIPALILQHNLFGIDIDPRAAQLAAFALTMKARSYYSRFLRKPVQPRVIALENVSEETIQQSVKLPITIKGKKNEKYSDLSLSLLSQADNLGSLVQIEPEALTAIKIQEGSIWQVQQKILKLQAEFLSRKYHCVVTNPPYMGSGGMNASIKVFVEKNYPKSKSDLMACFMERCLVFNPGNGKTAMINQQSWMFLSGYEELRPYIIDNAQLESMLHLGPRTFPEIGGEVVQNTAFVLGNYIPKESGIYIRLTEFKNAQLKDDKTIEAIQNPKCGWYYTADQKDFEKIPGSPISFWAKKYDIKLFENNKYLSDIAKPSKGMMTGENPLFIRFFWEVNIKSLALNVKTHEESFECNLKWYPYFKGGQFRRWYGNRENVVNFKNDGNDLKKSIKYGERNPSFYFKNNVNWTKISSGLFSARVGEIGSLYDDAACQCLVNKIENIEYIIGYLNSKIGRSTLGCLSNTLNFSPGEIAKIPMTIEYQIFDFVNSKVKSCLLITKSEWNSHENSWEFEQNELVKQYNKSLRTAFESYKTFWSEKFYELHSNEEELNNLSSILKKRQLV